MQYTFLRIKVPPALRVNLVTPRSLGDSPAGKITRPKNIGQPSSVAKTGDKQYEVVFSPSSAHETVDLVLSSGKFSFSSLLALFTLSFWIGMLPGRDFFRTFSVGNFISRVFMMSGILFVALVSLELCGVNIHKPFSRWLNTLEMAERSGDMIKGWLGESDPFFQSKEAHDFYSRTGKKLEKSYLLAVVIDEKTEFRMLVRKDFFPADDLDSAKNICEKEIDAMIPEKNDYDLIMKHGDMRSTINFAFAEWTLTDRGILSDDYELFILPEHVATWQVSVAEIQGSSGNALTGLAKDYDLDRGDMDDEELREKMIGLINRQVRLPLDTEVKYDDNVASFYLDADSQANFRCIRKLPNSE